MPSTILSIDKKRIFGKTDLTLDCQDTFDSASLLVIFEAFYAITKQKPGRALSDLEKNPRA